MTFDYLKLSFCLAVERGIEPEGLASKSTLSVVVTMQRRLLPLSNHHFRRSELAGGSSGAIDSYPMRSSSSSTPSSLALAVFVPIFNFRCS